MFYNCLHFAYTPSSMKKITLILFLGVAGSLTAFGQSAPKKASTQQKAAAPAKPAAPAQQQKDVRVVPDAAMIQKADQITAGMAQNLRLAPAQVARVKEINLNSMREVEEAKIKLKGNIRAMNAEIDNISKSRLSLLKEVLTPEQFAQYNKKREEKMGLSQPNTQQRPAPPQSQYDY